MLELLPLVDQKTLSTIIAMATFALVTSISPGPVNILATITSANVGYVRTIPHIAGATIGFVSILFILGVSFGFGSEQFLTEMPYISKGLTYIGGGFLLYLAYKVTTQDVESNIQLEQSHGNQSHDNRSNENQIKKNQAPTWFQGLMCQWLNPKAWIVSLAGVSIFINQSGINQNNINKGSINNDNLHNISHDLMINLVLFCSVFLIICYLSISVWAMLGSSIKTILATPTHFKRFNYLMAGLLSATVIYTFFI